MRDFGARQGAFASWVLENESDRWGVGSLRHRRTSDQRDGVMRRQERRGCSSGAWQSVASSELEQV